MQPNFIKEIMKDIDWRYSELSILRTIPFRYGLSDGHKNFLIRYSVPIIYSLWEGFVRNTFEIYVREINSLKLNYKELSINVLSHAISSEDKLNLRNPRMSFKSEIEFVEYLNNYISVPISISSKLPTNSNVNFEVINNLLLRFNLEELPAKGFKSKLNKLLRFRNSVSHGDNSIPVKPKDIEEFCETINDLMSEIFERIEKGHENKTYKKWAV